MTFTTKNTDNDSLDEQHEINVTPFIDVMLVLLIIFMVAAPLATVSVPVKLPAVAVAAPAHPENDDPTYLTLQEDLTLIFGEGDVIQQQNLAQELKQYGIEIEQRILLRADSKVEYGQFMVLMNQLTKAGYSKVALVGLKHETDVAQ